MMTDKEATVGKRVRIMRFNSLPAYMRQDRSGLLGVEGVITSLIPGGLVALTLDAGLGRAVVEDFWMYPCNLMEIK